MSIDKEKINEAYKKLPEEMKAILVSDETSEFVMNLGKKYQLHVDQTGALSNAIILIMVGLMRPNEFIPAVAKNLNIETDKAQQIAKEINDQIFAPIRESLKQVHSSAPKLNDEQPGETTREIRRELDPLDSFLSSNPNKDEVPPPRPYTQDPYHEPIE